MHYWLINNGISVLLPPIKELNLLGTISLNHNAFKNAKAIGKIVAFTVNAPPILSRVIKSTPILNSLSENKLILLLAFIKHCWIWSPENKLNADSAGVL